MSLDYSMVMHAFRIFELTECANQANGYNAADLLHGGNVFSVVRCPDGVACHESDMQESEQAEQEQEEYTTIMMMHGWMDG